MVRARSPRQPAPRLTLRVLLCASACTLALTAAPTEAHAADVAAANLLFDEAKALMAANKFAEACGKFEASFDADQQLGALMNLADCLERDGRVASAYGRWAHAVEFAKMRGDDRVDYATERRDLIEPLLSFVTVNAVGSGPDLVVYKGNSKLSPGAFGSALPSNPGETLIQVVRGEDVLWETKIVLDQKERKTVDVPLGEIAAQNPVTMRKRKDLGDDRMTAVTSGEEGFWSKLRIAGFVVGGVGVLGLGGGFLAGGLALGKRSDIDAQCTAGDGTRYCTPAGTAAFDEATTLAEISTWTLVASGIVTTIGITLIIAAPNDYQKLEERARVVPWFTDEAGGFVLQTAF